MEKGTKHVVSRKDHLFADHVNSITFNEAASRIQNGKPDEEYTPKDVFNEDIKEKKSCRPKAKGKKGKTMTNKEIREKNGPVITYCKPIAYATLIQASEDIQRQYVLKFKEKYQGIGAKQFAIILGCSINTSGKFLRKIGCERNCKGGYTVAERMGIKKFHDDFANAISEAEHIEEATKDVVTVVAEEEKVEEETSTIEEISTVTEETVHEATEIEASEIAENAEKSFMNHEDDDTIEEDSADSVSINNIEFSCDVNQLSNFIMRLGMNGRIHVVITKEES